MIATLIVAPAWLFASCFGLSIASALLPWLNGEAVVISFAVLMRSPLDLVLLTMVAAAGQVLGKCLLYRLAVGARQLSACGNGRFIGWLERLRQGRVRPMAVVFVSSLVGIPPLYLTTIAAGAAGMRFSWFLGAVTSGRIIRFAAVAFAPGLVIHAADS